MYHRSLSQSEASFCAATMSMWRAVSSAWSFRRCKIALSAISLTNTSSSSLAMGLGISLVSSILRNVSDRVAEVHACGEPYREQDVHEADASKDEWTCLLSS